VSARRHTSLDRLADDQPFVLDLLSVMAFFAAEPLPLGLLSEHADALPADLARQVADAEGRSRIASLLQEHSLASADADTVTLPDKVSAAVLARLDRSPREDWCRVALRLLEAAFPERSDDVRAWPACEALLRHVLQALGHAEALGLADERSVRLLDRAASYLLSRGEYSQAHELAKRALRDWSPERDDALSGTLHHTFGCALNSLGDVRAAREELEQAVAIHSTVLGPHHPDVVKDRTSLGAVLEELGDVGAAREQLEAAVASGEGRDALEVEDGVARRVLGWIALRDGDPETARAHYEQAIPLVEELCGPDHPEVAGGHTGLALVLEELGDLDRARSELERALAIAEAAQGADHPEVAVIRSNLGGVLQKLGLLAEAREQLERALATGEATLPEGHRGLWIRHRKLATVLEAARDLAQAREHVEHALQLSEQALGPGDPRVASDLVALGGVLTALGDHLGARDAYQRALTIVERNQGRDNPDVASHAVLVAGAARKAGDLPAAQTHLERALEIYERAEGPARTNASAVRIALARLITDLGRQLVRTYRALGRDDDAQALEEQTSTALARVLEGELGRGDDTSLLTLAEAAVESGELDLAETALQQVETGDDDSGASARSRRAGLGAGWHRLGRIWMEARDYGRAKRALDAALPLVETNPLSHGMVLHDLADVLRSQGEIQEAIDVYRQAAERKRQAGERGDPRHLALTLLALGRALRAAGNEGAALRAFEERLTILEALPTRDHQAEGITLHDIGDVRRTQARIDEAIDLYRRAAEHKRRAGDRNDPRDLALTLLTLGALQLERGDAHGARDAGAEAVRLLRDLTDGDAYMLGTALVLVGRAARTQQDVRGALAPLDEGYRVLKADGVANPIEVAVVAGLLAATFEGLDRHDEALRIAQEQLAGDDLKSIVAMVQTSSESGGARLAEAALESAQSAWEGRSDAEPQRMLGTAWHHLGRACREREDFDRARRAFEAALHLMPNQQSQGVLLHDIGDLHRAQDETDEAIDLYRRAAEHKRRAGDDGSPRDLATTLLSLGRTLETSGRHDEALEAYDERMAILGSLTERAPEAEGITLHDIGDVRRAQGQIDEAIYLYRQAADRKRQAGEHGNPRDLATTLLTLGRALEKRERYDDALAVYQERLEILESLPEPDHHAIGVTLDDIGDVRRAQGRTDEAIGLYRRAADHERRAGASGNPRSLATTLLSLGRALQDKGDDDAALGAYGQRLAILSSLPTSDPQAEGITLHDIGNVRRKQGRIDDAIELYRQAAEHKRQADERRDASDLAVTLLALAEAQLVANRPADGRESADEAARLLRDAPDAETRQLATALVLAADAAIASDDTEAALPLLEEGQALLREADPTALLELARVKVSLAAVQDHVGRESEAAGTRANARAILEEAFDSGVALDDLEVLSTVCMLCVACGALELARKVVDHARSLGAAAETPDPQLQDQVAEMLFFLGHAYFDNGEHDFEAALTAYAERLEILSSLPERDHQAEGITLHDIGNVRRAQARMPEAIDLYRQAADHKRQAGERGDPLGLATTLLVLGRALEEQGEHDAALDAYGERLAILSSLPERDHQAEGITFHDIGDVRRAQQQMSVAANLYREAADHKRRAGGKDLAASLLALGATRLSLGDASTATEAGKEALDLLRSLPDPRPDQLATALAVVAECALREGDAETALPLAEEANRVSADAPRFDPEVGRTIKTILAKAYEALGQPENARMANEQVERESPDPEAPEP
jgi:tetratricopeptide (TPR) repeat protein